MMQSSDDALELEQGPKSGRLRDFSSQLAQRLRAAPNMPAEPARLAARMGDISFLFDMSTTGEIVTLPEIAAVPWTKPWFRGLESLQLIVFGDLLKVNAAVLVTRAFGLRNLKDLEPIGVMSDPLRPWERERFRETDGTTLIELDLRRLVATEQFSAIGI